MTLSIIEFPDLRKKSSGERLCFYASAENSTGFDERVDIQRVAARMKKDVGDYREIYNKFSEKMTVGASRYSSTRQTIKDALDAVDTLPKSILDSEAVHAALKKVGAAARTIITLQALEIEYLRKKNTALQSENDNLRRPRAVVRQSSSASDVKMGIHKLVLTLLDLKEKGALPAYVPGRGRNSPNPDIWIEDRLSENGISAKQIELAKNDPAVWYQVDRRLYSIKVTRHLRERFDSSSALSKKKIPASALGGAEVVLKSKSEKRDQIIAPSKISDEELVA